jgi:hypothetical protein
MDERVFVQRLFHFLRPFDHRWNSGFIFAPGSMQATGLIDIQTAMDDMWQQRIIGQENRPASVPPMDILRPADGRAMQGFEELWLKRGM